MKIVFTGIQGCGKGTQARLLVENHDFTLVEMGVEFRKVMASGSELGNEVARIVDAGGLVNEELGAKVMREALKEYQDCDNVIFDGFIRLPWNLDVFQEFVDDYKVIFFDLETQKAKNRLLGRMYDTKTGETFPSSVSHNPHSGDELIKRDDDKDEAAILARFDAFENDTLPIVALQREEGRIIDINADQSIDEVYADVISKLGLENNNV